MQNLPFWSPQFQMTELLELQYKPFPSYPNWLTAWDMFPIILQIFDEFSNLNDMHVAQQEQIDAQAATIATMQAAINQLQIDLTGTDAVANQGVTDAATAYGLAETANIKAENLEVRMTAAEARLDVLEA